MGGGLFEEKVLLNYLEVMMKRFWYLHDACDISSFDSMTLYIRGEENFSGAVGSISDIYYGVVTPH